MIRLVKKTNKWQEWLVEYKGKSYPLAPNKNAGMFDENRYEFPNHNEVKIYLEDISKLKFSDIPEELVINVSWEDNNLGECINFCLIEHKLNKTALLYSWGINPRTFSKNINPNILRKEMHSLLLNTRNSELNYSVDELTDIDENLNIYFDVVVKANSNIGITFEKLSSHIDELYKIANEKLLNGDLKNKIVTQFSFDKTVQEACTRYLQYFIEFLKDIGIDADSEIKKKGSNILFSITPLEKDNGLKKISEALAVYLCLPETDFFEKLHTTTDLLSEILIEKLKSEINKLKSDIKINQALIKYQEKQFISQDITPVGGVSPIEGLYSISVDDTKIEKAEFFGGFLKLGTYKVAGIEINWSKLLVQIKKNK